MTLTPGTALVTGAGRRIGKAIALDLAAAGWAVAVHCNKSRDEADAVAAQIERGGGRAAVIAADLSDLDAVTGLVPAAEAALGPVSLLVNNAALFEPDTPATIRPDLWTRQLTVDLAAPCFLAKDMAARLPAGGEGLIVNIIDQRVWRLRPDFFSYTLAKSALWTATQTLAQGLAPRIRVNAIGPGPTLIGSRQSQAHFDRQVAAVPLKRGPSLEEVCGAVRFFIATPSVTGQMLALDGGQHLAWETADVIGGGE
jgi:NAD(P)-dependent dehydrogenase (short-subunit alcohol dehydrogenase family)